MIMIDDSWDAKPTLVKCICGAIPQCYHDETEKFGVECYTCYRTVHGCASAIAAITKWNEETLAQLGDKNATLS